MKLINDTDRQQIAAAIKAVESKTSGELVTVIAPAADDYIYIPTLVAALIALVTPAILGLTGYALVAEHSYLIQIVSFLFFTAMFRWQPLTMLLIPKRVKYQRAHRVAMEQFFAQNLHHTEKRNAVLIFVSAAEHYVEIIADKGINDHVSNDAWQVIVGKFIADIKARRIADGFVNAVNACGEHLQQHYPADQTNQNELANHLIVLD
ncbi:MAG: TPM domain-containing protein [Gammaproteobacteria bacterium]|nr:TPM domain-containing protein [Gammaproteobacteria bacterium]